MERVIGVLLWTLLFGSVLLQKQPQPETRGAAPSGRIVNGSDASIRNHKFVVLLRVDDFPTCGSSVITNTHVLTAAHCFDRRPKATSVTLYAGSSSQYHRGVTFQISSYIIHPNYLRSGVNYDAAIATIIGSFAGYPNIAPILLQNTEIAVSANNPMWCYVVGWGYTNVDTEEVPENLQFIYMHLITHRSCEEQWGEGSITPEMICTYRPYVDTCNGDSGGPLVCDGRLTGLVSWGGSDCDSEWPAVFTKVAARSIRSFVRRNALV